MVSDGALDTDVSERKALGWMITALSDGQLVIDALYETIEGRTDGEYSLGLTYMIITCVDEHAGSYHWRRDAIMARHYG